MKPDAQARLDYLSDMRALLWPPAGSNASASIIRPMRVLPNRAQPRLFAPATPRRAPASAVVRYVAQQPRLARAKGMAVAAAVRGGWHERGVAAQPIEVGGGASVDEHLAEVLGHPVSTSLALTPSRANRKPVLQVFDDRGRTVAFAKVAVSALSTSLVRAEAAALREVATHDTPHLVVPAALDCREWHGLTVLVTSVLPAFSTGRHRGDLLTQAMLEISRIPAAGAPTDVDGYLDTLNARVDGAAGSIDDDVLSVWHERFVAAAERARSASVAVGAWHGDWTPWNCVATRTAIAAWDWERFTGAGLTGYDRLHYSLHTDAIGRGRGFAVSARDLLARAPALLTPWRLGDDAARAVAALYLLDVSLRYAADGQRTARGAGAIDVWALPALAAAEPSHR